MTERVYIYDTTLRDGAQTKGVDFSVRDKQEIAQALDAFGIDYIEGGWPGANPTDDKFFEELPQFSHSKAVAFGMTRRPNTSAKNDPGLASLVNITAGASCIVGKAWDFHVTDALDITLEENTAMVKESIAHLKSKGKEVLFDAEHFFDGYKANPEFALATAQTAYDAGARWVVLCDTNGGVLPDEVEQIVRDVCVHVPGDHLAIHCHNDTENAVANSLAAVRAGARQVQGTINGLGERCGNANLTSIIPSLKLKMGYEIGISDEQLKGLKKLSFFLNEKLNRPTNRYAPYVGNAAFAHKGGLHVSAVEKNPQTYEHIAPESVGNQRLIIMSNQAGRANVMRHLKDVGIEIDPSDEKVAELVRKVKEMENLGYSYDGANGSFEVLARRVIEDVPQFFSMAHFQVVDDRKWDEKGELQMLSTADVTLNVGGKEITKSAQGNGPVNALDTAIHDALAETYPAIKNVKLADYKVRIINPETGTKAVTRVIIESTDDEGNSWSTVGVSGNIIDASYNALRDSLVYKLLQEK